MPYNPSVLDREENGALKLHLRKNPVPRPPQTHNKAQEMARKAKQAQHINDRKKS